MLPVRLWDIYQRGQSMHELKDKGTFNVEEVYEEVYEEGNDAGLYDSCEPLHYETNLHKYLTGKPLNSY